MTKLNGYILISRALFKHSKYKPSGVFSRYEAWCWMINEAAFKSRPIEILEGRSRKMIQLERGQFSHSVRFLSSKWRWSPNRVRRFLADAETDTEIVTQTDTGQMVISLVNYATYQDPHALLDTQADTQSGTQMDTKKKEGSRKKDNNPARAPASDQGFAVWYAIYPRKKQPEAAQRSYGKIIAGGKITHADLLTRTAAFAAHWQARIASEPGAKQFIPYPASWLNSGEFNDEPETVAATAKPSTPAPEKPTGQFGDADWLDCLSFQKRHGWSSEWGPPPGAPGCLVPPHLIVTPVSSSKGAA